MTTGGSPGLGLKPLLPLPLPALMAGIRGRRAADLRARLILVPLVVPDDSVDAMVGCWWRAVGKSWCRVVVEVRVSCDSVGD